MRVRGAGDGRQQRIRVCPGRRCDRSALRFELVEFPPASSRRYGRRTSSFRRERPTTATGTRAPTSPSGTSTRASTRRRCTGRISVTATKTRTRRTTSSGTIRRKRSVRAIRGRITSSWCSPRPRNRPWRTAVLPSSPRRTRALTRGGAPTRIGGRSSAARGSVCGATREGPGWCPAAGIWLSDPTGNTWPPCVAYRGSVRAWAGEAAPVAGPGTGYR